MFRPLPSPAVDWIDARPLRAHVRTLVNDGIDVALLAHAADVPLHALRSLLQGRRGRHTTLVYRPFAARLIHVSAYSCHRAAGTRESNVVARALVASLREHGVSEAQISLSCGVDAAALAQLQLPGTFPLRSRWRLQALCQTFGLASELDDLLSCGMLATVAA